MKIFTLLSIVLYGIIGIVAMIMAMKCLFARKFIPFHGKAAGILWEELPKTLQSVIIALNKAAGLGFLLTGMLLLAGPSLNYFRKEMMITIAIPLFSLIFCMGLFVINLRLYQDTKSATPRTGSLIACLIVLTAAVLAYL